MKTSCGKIHPSRFEMMNQPEKIEPQMIPWTAGTQLGPYMLLLPIGSGGMGEVWKARDTRLNRIVAVKRLKEEHRKRFEQEARAIAALNHPHICQLYDVGPDYLVMEHIEGTPPQFPLPADTAVQLAIQIASALEEAHSRGIIHRDLKPANILVTASGTAKLLDFGLAKPVTATDSDVTRNTMDGAVMGTAAYLSPEQAEGKPLDARSDIFSFGAVLYEMLSGSRAFEGSSMAQVLSAVLRDDPRPLQHVPPALQRIVSRCLAKEPGQRFPTMSDVKSALEQVPVKSSDSEASIAVLPFTNMSADKENEYFSDGLAEEIINALTHIPGLKVTARTSAFAFRGKEQDIRKIAQALDVRTILEGSVRRAGNRIRVMAQLINAANGYHLWSERYDREMSDVFAIQDEIAQAIAAALQVTLSGESVTVRRYTPRLPAYEAYLKALYYAQKLTPESLTVLSETTLPNSPYTAYCRHTKPCPACVSRRGKHWISIRRCQKRMPCWAWWPRSTTTTGRKPGVVSSLLRLANLYLLRSAIITGSITCLLLAATKKRLSSKSEPGKRTRLISSAACSSRQAFERPEGTRTHSVSYIKCVSSTRISGPCLFCWALSTRPKETLRKRPLTPKRRILWRPG